ncbi:Semaphorin-5B, partial [Ameca splendens]
MYCCRAGAELLSEWQVPRCSLRSGELDYRWLTVCILFDCCRNVNRTLSSCRVHDILMATEWAPDEETRKSCQSKGKTEMECQNYIRVLLVNKTEVMTCGTNAFQPLCITREVGNMSRVLERVNGVARCPYDPRHNSTAVVTESGELYAATVIDFSGRDPVIYRSLGGMPPLRTAQYNSKWLN